MAAKGLFDVSGDVVFITGASSGLGQHFAQTLARAGAVVVLTARREAQLKAVVAGIEAEGGKASCVAMDALSPDSVRDAVAEALRRHGRIDTLIANAGILVDGKSPQNHTEEDFASVVGTNLTGTWRCANEVAKQWMLQHGGGNIVVIGSILAARTTKGSSAYLAAKAGAHHLTKALAVDWANKNIRVNCMAPGFVLTDLTSQIFEKQDSGGKAGERELNDVGKAFAKGIPMRSFVKLEDLDGALMLLCSGASRKMTGSIVVVDGGHTAAAL